MKGWKDERKDGQMKGWYERGIVFKFQQILKKSIHTHIKTKSMSVLILSMPVAIYFKKV